VSIKAFQLTGKVKEVLIANQHENHQSTPVQKATFIQGQGILHDKHYGPRLLDERDAVALHLGLPKGMESFNTRQWSAVSQAELNETAKHMGISNIEHGLLGENLIVTGIPGFSRLPPGTLLFFKSQKGELRTTILSVFGENSPCYISGDIIQARHPDQQNLTLSFINNAKHRRGLMGFIIGSGIIKAGDTIIVEVPDQKIYAPQKHH
jgi:hypothetical protein